MRMFKPPIISALLVLGLTACATGGVMSTTEGVARLEQQQKASPSSAPVQRSLGIAYYKAARYPDARSALETATRLDPTDGTTALYLGLSAEELGDLAAAKKAYSSYITFGRTSRVRSQLQSRLAALTRKEIDADAKKAVQQEASLAGQPTSPMVIAVMPLRFSGPDSSLRPLERGFADLLTTDLARSSQLTLVERSRMQALLDEIKLQRSGATDAASNVRAGKMMRAGRVVQGSLNQVGAFDLRADAAVVDVPTSQIRGTVNASDQLEAVFNLEKKVALDLFTQLGVTLSPAERNAIEQRPTRSMQAFLAYSRGLSAEDEGRYDDALRFFNEASRIDPGFQSAAQKSAEVRQVSTGQTVTAATVESSLKGTAEGAVVTAATQGNTLATVTVTSGLGSTVMNTAGDINTSAASAATGAAAGIGAIVSTPGSKDPVSTGTGSDNPTGTAKVTIIIKRP